jgi:hypothetical protein
MIPPAPTIAERRKKTREKSHPGESLQPAAKKVEVVGMNQMVEVAGENKKPIVDTVFENEVAKAVPVVEAEVAVDDEEEELAEMAVARVAPQDAKTRLIGRVSSHAVRAELRRLGFPGV